MHNHEGRTLFDFEGIPLSQVNSFLALLKEKPSGVSEDPEDEEPPKPN
jgi:hypothetical protein